MIENEDMRPAHWLKRWTFLLAAGLLVSLAGLATLGGINAGEGDMDLTFKWVQGERFEGVIVPPIAAAAVWEAEEGRKTEGGWEADEGIIQKLEAALPDYLNAHDNPRIATLSEKLDDYKRQYMAIVEEGRRLVELRALCQLYLDENDVDLMADIPEVQDGGDCFFEVLFDADGEQFLWARVHGES